ncbi:MAG: YraN family protein [Pseudomonadota bacterium]
MADRRAAGDQAEAAALDYLTQRGLKLIARNYRCRAGELDLVLSDGDTLVVAEVRYRQANAFGSAAQSVGPRKQQRLTRAAQHFLMRHPKLEDLPVRFDVVALDGSVDGRSVRIEWLKDAF